MEDAAGKPAALVTLAEMVAEEVLARGIEDAALTVLAVAALVGELGTLELTATDAAADALVVPAIDD